MSTILSVVMLMYNEEKVAERNLNELLEYMHKSFDDQLSWEVVVVDDGSRDTTPAILKRLATQHPLTIATHPYNLGRGQGIRTGFRAAQGEYVIFMDADLSYAPEHIAELLAPLRDGTADITLASAYHPAGEVENVPFVRLAMSRAGNWVLGNGLARKLNTVTCLVRGFRRQVLNDLILVSRDKDIHLEILNKALMLGYRIMELPARLKWRDRSRGGKGGSLRTVLRMADTISSHLLFGYMFRPSVLARIPVFLLLAVCMIGIWVLARALVTKLAFYLDSEPLHQALYHALHQTLVDGQITLLLLAFSALGVVQIVTMLFMAKISKLYHEDIYMTLVQLRSQLNGQGPQDGIRIEPARRD